MTASGTTQTAVIAGFEARAAHDGDAELVVRLRHGNGGQSEVVLDRHAAAVLLAGCGNSGADGLVGQSWERVRDALEQAWNRLQPTQ